MRLKEIMARLAQIKTELEQEGADIAALTAEADALLAERQQIEAAATQRRDVLDRISRGIAGSVVGTPAAAPAEPVTEPTNARSVISTPEYRSAWAKVMMQCPDSEFTEPEMRALGEVLTTTATTAIAASANADGVNNGGLFVPEGVMTDFLNRIAVSSPVFNDLKKLQVTGLIKFPYKVSQDGTKARTEGAENDDTSFTWAEITIINSEVSATCRVSWKLESMTPDSFVDYIIDELVAEHGEKIIEQAIYGTGTGGDTLGITESTVIDAGYDEGTDALDAIKDALALMNAKLKIGAKIYLASDLAENIAFMKDQNGAYINNPVNGVGINSVARIAVEVDPYLNAGEFLIGDLKRNVVLNFNEGIGVTKDTIGRKRINDYTTYSLVGAAVKPNSIAYGYVAIASADPTLIDPD